MEELIEEKTFTEHEDSYGIWHRNRDFYVKSGGHLSVRGMITGCGIMQVYGVSSLKPEVTKEELKTLFSELKDNGCGAVVCTLGDLYYNPQFQYEQNLLNAGFELLSEYHNYRHGNIAMQRLYIFKL